MYVFLDIALTIFHSGLVLFNLFGWIWRKTRKAHLITIVATFLSWTLLGVFYGIGYCPFTDWQWDIKRKLGETDLPPSFIEYYLEKITLIDWSPVTVDTLVLVSSLLALVASLWLNFINRGSKS